MLLIKNRSQYLARRVYAFCRLGIGMCDTRSAVAPHRSEKNTVKTHQNPPDRGGLAVIAEE